VLSLQREGEEGEERELGGLGDNDDRRQILKQQLIKDVDHDEDKDGKQKWEG
jgi:hypothetical protein